MQGVENLNYMNVMADLELTITLNFYSILGLTFIVGTAVYFYIRYRYLTVYSTLPSTKQPQIIDLEPIHHQETSDDGFMRGFLSSIRIFGYLEEPVFQELVRNLETRQLYFTLIK